MRNRREGRVTCPNSSIILVDRVADPGTPPDPVTCVAFVTRTISMLTYMLKGIIVLYKIRYDTYLHNVNEKLYDGSVTIPVHPLNVVTN